MLPEIPRSMRGSGMFACWQISRNAFGHSIVCFRFPKNPLGDLVAQHWSCHLDYSTPWTDLHFPAM